MVEARGLIEKGRQQKSSDGRRKTTEGFTTHIIQLPKTNVAQKEDYCFKAVAPTVVSLDLAQHGRD